MGGFPGFGDAIKIEGGTDDAEIGNVGDRLKVNSTVTPGNPGGIATLPATMLTEDLNASVGGVARDTLVTTGAWVDVYSISDAGLFLGFLLNLEEPNKWRIRLVIDGNEIFGSNGIKTADLDGKDLYGYVFLKEEKRDPVYHQGFNLAENTVYYQPPLNSAIQYTTSIVIKVIKDTGADKKFRAGLASRTT